MGETIAPAPMISMPAPIVETIAPMPMTTMAAPMAMPAPMVETIAPMPMTTMAAPMVEAISPMMCRLLSTNDNHGNLCNGRRLCSTNDNYGRWLRAVTNHFVGQLTQCHGWLDRLTMSFGAFLSAGDPSTS